MLKKQFIMDEFVRNKIICEQFWYVCLENNFPLKSLLVSWIALIFPCDFMKKLGVAELARFPTIVYQYK